MVSLFRQDVKTLSCTSHAYEGAAVTNIAVLPKHDVRYCIIVLRNIVKRSLLPIRWRHKLRTLTLQMLLDNSASFSLLCYCVISYVKPNKHAMELVTLWLCCTVATAQSANDVTSRGECSTAGLVRESTRHGTVSLL